MNEMKAPWQRTFEAFAGPGIHRPSDMMRVSESEARALLPGVIAQDWQAPVFVGADRHGGYIVGNGTETWSTGLFHAGALVGFYAASSLWIAKAHRGLGLSTPLILAAAAHRGGTILPPGVVFQGYTAAGVAAHRSAHSHAVLTAVAEGLPVPTAVIAEMQRNGQGLSRPDAPFACLP